ncbi:hypothetical protein [Kitasatospora sp. NPDC087314]|uniref:hypothetical protein n=1 Tax=Kitasatospora sp. NPDC087314 TaxID=3364068 RepID=UPI003808D83A
MSSAALACSRSASVRESGSYCGRGTPAAPSPPTSPYSTSWMCRCQASAFSCSRTGTVWNSPHCGTPTCGRAPVTAKSGAATR